MGKARFGIPLFMFVVGTMVALQLITLVTSVIPPTQLFPETLSPTAGTDIAIIMAIFGLLK